ncbi:MAG TPA: VWA domain-containing protein [Pirellulaceae bacterium]|nr:VWA domain-containing protein [Pirellulaceae bacterium]
MAFLNASLLAGGALMAIPVILHLLMRQKPRQLVFPALRFVKERRESNTRRLRLRHWLLLALRCAAVGLVALALARPSVASALLGNYVALGLVGLALLAALLLTGVAVARKLAAPLIAAIGLTAVALGVVWLVFAYRAFFSGRPVLGSQELPVAAVMVVDTSPRMEYRHENRTRLETARETAAWLVKQLPADSEVAVVDSRPGGANFAIDRTAAEKAIERLRPTGTPRPLTEVIFSAVGLARQNTRPRKEVYVLTDLTAAAWKADRPQDLAKALGDNADVQLYVIDVGVEQPRNYALGALELSSQILPPGAKPTIEVEIKAIGLGGTRQVELRLEEPDPTLPIIRDGKPVFPKSFRSDIQEVTLRAGDSQRVTLKVEGVRGQGDRGQESADRGQEPVTPDSGALTPGIGLPLGTHQGVVRLLGEDGLALDDVRYFAVEVQPDWPIAVFAPAGVPTDDQVRALASNPKARFRCDVLPQAELANKTLEDYRAVCLLDPQPLPAEAWDKLAAYVEGGGGLALALGFNAQPPNSFQDEAAQVVLGGKLTRQTRSAGDLYLSPTSYDHPLLAEFRSIEANVPWDRYPVFYHWNLDELREGTRTIIAYGNNKPALVENRLGRGRVLVMTTPISDPLRPRSRKTWNELWYGEDAWPGFVLWNEMLLYLVGAGQTRLNYQAGDTAVLANDPAKDPERYQLFSPLEEPQDVLARDERVTVRFTDNAGAYRLRGQRDGPLVRGFAVNFGPDVGDLTRLPREKLDDLLGKDRFQFARSREEINRAVGVDRIGSEFYPLLVTLLALTLGMEHLLANKFYRKDD